jgi:hypothetical protein
VTSTFLIHCARLDGLVRDYGSPALTAELQAQMCIHLRLCQPSYQPVTSDSALASPTTIGGYKFKIKRIE